MKKIKYNQLILCYAYALFDLSKEKLEVFNENVAFLLAFLRDNEQIVLFFSSPANSIVIKNDIILFLKNYIDDTLLSFIIIVIHNNRFFLLEDIFTRFLILVKKFKNEIDITVTSALPLSEDDMRFISDSMLNFGRVMGFVNIVDSSILGGLIIREGFTMVDASLKSYLERLLMISKEAI